MREKQVTGMWGSASLIITLIITKALISTPSLFARNSASAGWIEVVISGLFDLFLLVIILKLASNYDNKDIIDISEAIFGKKGRYVTGIFSVIVFVISSAAVFRCFCELIRNTVLKGISYDDISFFVLVVSIVGAFSGLRVLLNSCGIVLPCILISIAVIALVNFPRHSITNIFPFLGSGVGDVIRNALFENASFYEMGIVLFLIPYFGDKSSVKKICFTGLTASILVTSIITLSYQLSVPYEVAGTFALPLYQMTRMIKAGTFFQRIEPLNVFVWGAAIYTYVSVGVRMSAYIYKKTFALTRTKPLVFIFAYIVSMVALIPSSETSVERIYDFLMKYSYIAYPILPLLLLICGAVFSKKRCNFEKA
ncbi:MAG: endospore germination permease [Clostridia bacterium]|nr:endospore germination permease [Clostridia bacterium]